jgi:hypothetical protein
VLSRRPQPCATESVNGSSTSHNRGAAGLDTRSGAEATDAPMATIDERQRPNGLAPAGDGRGTLITAGGMRAKTSYSFATRFEKGAGTNPEELKYRAVVLSLKRSVVPQAKRSWHFAGRVYYSRRGGQGNLPGSPAPSSANHAYSGICLSGGSSDQSGVNTRAATGPWLACAATGKDAADRRCRGRSRSTDHKTYSAAHRMRPHPRSRGRPHNPVQGPARSPAPRRGPARNRGRVRNRARNRNNTAPLTRRR